jgi:thiamine kinase-like enzyme
MSKTNIIKVIENTLSKTFVRKDGLYNELSGLTLLKDYKTNTPHLLGVGKKKCLTTYITNGTPSFEAIKNGMIAINEVNRFLLEHISGLKKFDNSEPWGRFCESVFKKFTNNKGSLIKPLGGNLYFELLDGVKQILLNISSKDEVIFLHGDLHLGNILYDTKINEFWLIDFEHSKYGPIEYEFINSYFWNDEKSLDIGFFSTKLDGFSTKNLKELNKLYFADQLNIALEMNDKKKIIALIQKYNEKSFKEQT